MFQIIKRRKAVRRLLNIGSRIEVNYILYINNDEPVTLTSYEDAKRYIEHYRSENAIFLIKIYRVELYSL